MDNIKVGKIIKELRLSKGLSQAEVATICNVTAPAVSKWERGESIPDISSLENLSSLFEVSINEIINSKAVINVTTNKNIFLYRVIVVVLVFAVFLISVLWIRYYYDMQSTINQLVDEQELGENDINNIELGENDTYDKELNDFLAQKEQPYHLYFEASTHKYIEDDIIRWIREVFIQEPNLYDYFNGNTYPSLNNLIIDTTGLIRVNNEVSTIRVIWDRNDDEYFWDIDVTYYDIKSDDRYERLNGMHHVTSNGNKYDFGVFDNGYFVLYELLEGNNIYDNYYFHISDLKPRIINDEIRIDYELNKIGVDVIFTDNHQETRYHFTLSDYDGSHSSWFFQYNINAYLSFIEGNREVILRDYVLDFDRNVLYLEAYEDDSLIWDDEISIYDYLPREINVDELDYIIRYQKEYTGLLHIEFERKIDGHLMSYKLLPDELNK